MLQIKVLSGSSRDSTIQKLGLDLIQQLQWQKNRDSSISECSGFYFHFREGDMDHVTMLKLVWKDKRFSYVGYEYCLSPSEVKPIILRCTQEMVQLINRISNLSTTPTNFIVPLSKTFIMQHFGPRAIQVSSGESVVIINEASKVFKKPLNKEEDVRLNTFFMKRAEIGLYHSILPTNVIPLSHDVTFFEFPLCSSPLTLAQARAHLKYYALSVSEAIVELHDSGYAHLDTRPENICFVDNHAVLIDLDRSYAHDTDGLEFYYKYARSEMYRCNDRTWTAENLDWKQFGLMITNIMENRSGTSYHLQTGDGHDDPFIKELCESGKLEAHT